MGLGNYFFDTYALVELVKGNPAFSRFKDEQVVITMLNLIELTNAVLVQFGKEKAELIYRQFRDCVFDLTEEIVIESMQFKQAHKKKKLSYADCVGYIFAQKNKLRFLTGDEQFRDLENVEFVKA